jgi:hypothetical protein
MHIRDIEIRCLARAVRIAEQCVASKRAPLWVEAGYIMEAVKHLAAIEERQAVAKAKTEAECLTLAAQQAGE